MIWPPEFTRMVGRWNGTVKMTDRSGQPMGRWQLRVTCSIDSDKLSITNERTDEKGDSTASSVQGTLTPPGIVMLASNAIKGRAWGSNGAVLAYWELLSDPKSTFWELSVIHDHEYRTRTWHHLKDGALSAISIIEERRTS